MPSVEIIAIGSELLLGELQDTNTQYLAKQLNKAGYDIYRTMIIGDNKHRITSAIQEALLRCDFVITTGGLGPTVDDPTRQAVADLNGSSLEFHPELWQQIQSRFKKFGRHPTQNNRQQAYLPYQAKAIKNPVGTAPAFWLNINGKLVFCLPGVPSEMIFLFEKSVLPLLKRKLPSKKTIHTIILHTVGMGESQIDESIADLEILTNPTIGLAAHPAQVDIRITAKADSVPKAKRMISPILNDLHKRLGNVIFGIDEMSLSDVINQAIKKKGCRLSILLGTNLSEIGHELIQLMIAEEITFSSAPFSKLEIMGQKLYNDRNICVLGLELKEEHRGKLLSEFLISSAGISKETKRFINQPSQQNLWLRNTILNFIRCHLSEEEK